MIECCTRLSGVAEKYVGLVQDMYEDSDTVGRCAVRVADGFKVMIHQGSQMRSDRRR